MKITIWGARGSIPTPPSSQSIREKIITALEGAGDVDLSDPLAIRAYVDSLSPLVVGTAGGNTACVEIQASDQQIIIDAGSGIRQLAARLMEGPCGRGAGIIHLFLSHTHWDHIQGFPFFTPAFVPGNRIYIYSVHSVEQVLIDQMQPATFPISLADMRSRSTIQFVRLEEERSLSIGNVTVTPLRLPHPGGSYAYRFEHRGSIAVYASDAEYKYLDDNHLRPYVRFFAGADLLLFDAQYTLRESLIKEDWGHSSALVGVEIARRAGVKRLMLFHHDPNSSDHDLQAIVDQTLAYQTASEEQPTFEVMLATEGLTVDLEPVGTFRLRRLAEEAAILAISADFDQRAIDDVLREISGPAPAGRLPRLVIDLSGVPRLGVGCLRALIDVRRHWGDRPLALAGVSQQARLVIELAHCSDMFPVYSTVQTALAALEARDSLTLPGQLLKQRYRIEALLGESDLGMVFRAVDIRLERPVLIKVLSPSLSPSLTQRLLQEARHMGRLQAPNIVTLYDCDEDQELAYLVMEYAANQTLRDVMLREDRPAPLAIADGILRGLEYAHSKNVVHGNLKPENVLIADEVKLTDFALGRISKDADLADSLGLFGVPYYLAPEQIAGGPLDGRADLYALGVILYELFTGRRPFEGDARDVLDAHLKAAPLPPRQLNPELSRSLEYLILKLLAKDPEQRYASATQVRRVLSSLETTPSQLEPAPVASSIRRQRRLIGRDLQLQRLLKLWQQVQHKEGQVLLLAGESGIGKTSLAEELAAQAPEAQVVIGRCSELEGNPPYQPFVEIGREYCGQLPAEELRTELSDAVAALAPLIPELREMLPALPAAAPLEPEQERLRLMHSFTQLVARAAAKRPCLMILDDLHWADPASLEMLHYLARHVHNQPLLIIGIYRDVELDGNHPLRELVRGLSRTAIYHHLVLNRLELDDVRQLVQDLLQSNVPEEWVAAIFERTGGNPFYVEEVIRTLVDEGVIALRDGSWRFAPVIDVRLPQSVRDLVLRRLGRLSASTQDLLRRVAVLGLQCSFADLTAVSGQAEEQLLELLDEALGGDLLRELDGGTMLAFSHPEIQQVIYEDLSALRRRSLHRRAGEALEARYAANLEPIVGQLAYHFLQAGDRPRGFHYSLQAAQQARSFHAFETALAWYLQAQEALPESAIDPAARVELYEGLGTAYYMQARYSEAIAAYSTMQQVAQTSGDLEAEARMWNGMSDVQVRQGDYRAALECAQRAAEIARAAGSQRELANGLYGQGWALMRLGSVEQAVALGEQILELSRSLQLRDMVTKSLNLLGSATSSLGHFDQAVSYFEEGLAICREDGNQRAQAAILNNMGETSRTLGDYQRANLLYEEALSIATRTGNLSLQRSLSLNLAAVQVGLGDYHSAEARLRQIVRVTESELWSGVTEVFRFLGEACLGAGKRSDALAAAQKALFWSQISGEREHGGCAWRVMGMVLAQNDDHLSTADLSLEQIAPPQEGGDEPLVDAARCFAESLRILSESGMAAERARTLRSWALYELEHGDRLRGEQLWQEAQALFSGLGMELELQRMAGARSQTSLSR